MKLAKRIALGVVGMVVIGVLGFVGYVELRWNRTYDEVAGPDLHASSDPKLIERGRYLVRGPAHCSNCHVADFDEFARADKGEELPLRGGLDFVLGPMGTIFSKNLTSDPTTGLGRYSDQQVFRLLRHGIKPDGTVTLPPLMPFQHLADEDLIAIVSYLRTLAPVSNVVPPVRYSFLGKALRTFIAVFRPVMDENFPRSAPPEAPTRQRGEYLARYVSNCIGCHTKVDLATGRFVGPDFAGGGEFEPMPVPGSDPDVWFRTPNLTPDPNGALAKFPTKESWIKRFRAGRVFPGSVMHWGPFSRMSDADLEALWIFFRSLPPVAFDAGPTPMFRKQ